MEFVFLALLIILMALALGYGYPVAFALPGSAILAVCLAAVMGYLFESNVDAYFAQGGPGQWLSAGVTNLRGVYWEVERDTLIAIPLFIFMGIMLQRSKIAEDLLVTMAQLFGPVPGGLGISVVFVGALLAATTGIVGATVVAMGLISLPAMLRNNYSRSLATGTIAASGTLGQIIPPSIVLIILADQLASATDQASSARKALHKVTTGELSMPSEFDVSSTSAGEMFLGAFVPGLVLVGLYMAFILGYALLRPHHAPAIHSEEPFDAKFFLKVLLILVPPLGLIALVLGSIIAGIATVNQAGAIGATGALFMAGYRLKEGQKGAYYPVLLGFAALIVIGVLLANFEINVKNVKTETDIGVLGLATVAVLLLLIALFWSSWRAYKIENTLQSVMVETAKTSSLVFIILLGAAMLTAAFRGFGGEELVRDFLNSLPGGFWLQFTIVMAVIFIMGFFLDFIEIAVVVVPVTAPILLADPSANVTAVWLGVMIGLNIQTSFLTPPFGFALFYLRGVAPPIVKTVEMYRGVAVFIFLQLAALGVVALYPNLVNYLPNRVSLTSDTAPPPRNPKLQFCVEEYVVERLATEGAAIEVAIQTARNLDLSPLPKKLAANTTQGFDSAEEALALLSQTRQASQDVAAGSEEYRPLLTATRIIERQVRGIDKEIKELQTDIQRLPQDTEVSQKAELDALLAELQTTREHLLQEIPVAWPEAHKKFKALKKIESNTRRQYQRTADNAYNSVAKLLATLQGTEAYKALQDDLKAIREQVATRPPAEMVAPVLALSKQFGAIEGASKIKSTLSKARRALRAKTPSQEKALKEIDQALALYAEQKVWREQATATLLSGLTVYEAAIRETIGIRQQKQLTHEQALFVASCNSGNRDISLNF